MAGAFSDYMEGKVIDWLKGTAMPTAPTNLYIGLFTTQPADTGTEGAPSDGTEASGTAYARVTLTLSNFTKAASGTTTQITYTASITFAQAGASWGTITGWGIWDASSAGNLIAYGAISPTQAVSSGQTPSFAANAIVISLD